MHMGHVLKNTENKFLPGSFTQFQPQSRVKTVGIEPLSQFGVQQTACLKAITESVSIAPSISTFPPRALLSVERETEQKLPHSYQISSVLHPILNERLKTVNLNSFLYLKHSSILAESDR